MKYVRRRFKPHDGRLISTMRHTLVITGDDVHKVVGFMGAPSFEVHEWCDENFGKGFNPHTWCVNTAYNGKKVVFFFNSKEHAMAFKLRWI